MFFTVFEAVQIVIFQNGLQQLLRLGFSSLIDSKPCPRDGILSLANRQKSHGAKSGKYGVCGTIFMAILMKNLRKINAI